MTRKPLIHLIVVGVLLAALLGAYGAWFVVVDQQSAKARGLAGDIQSKRQDTARIAAAKIALAALSSDEESIATHFVSTADVVPFLEALQSTGSRLGSKVEVASVSADQGKAHGHLTLSLQISGSFDAVMRTIGALEYAPYDITLTSLTLDTPGAGPGKGARAWNAAAIFTVGTATSTPKAAAPLAPPKTVAPITTATTTP